MVFAPVSARPQSRPPLPLTAAMALRSEHWPSPVAVSSRVVVTVIVAAAAGAADAVRARTSRRIPRRSTTVGEPDRGGEVAPIVDTAVAARDDGHGPTGGTTMSRVMTDCRRFPSESNCSLVIIGEQDEVERAAIEH